MNNKFENKTLSKEIFLKVRKDFLNFLESPKFNSGEEWVNLGLQQGQVSQILNQVKEWMQKYFLEDLVSEEDGEWIYLSSPTAIENDVFLKTDIFLSRNRLCKHYDWATFNTLILYENIAFIDEGKDFLPLLVIDPEGSELLKGIINLYPDSCKISDDPPFLSDIDYSVFNLEIIRRIEIQRVSAMWYYLVLKYIDDLSYCGPFLESREYLANYKMNEIYVEFENTGYLIEGREMGQISKAGLMMYSGSLEILATYICKIPTEDFQNDKYEESIGLVNYFYDKEYKSLLDLMSDDLEQPDLYLRPYYYWRKKFESFSPGVHGKRLDKVSKRIESSRSNIWKPNDVWEFFKVN